MELETKEAFFGRVLAILLTLTWPGVLGRNEAQNFRNHNNVSHYLEIQSRELVLYAGYQTPQLYWSMADDSRKSNNNVFVLCLWCPIHGISMVQMDPYKQWIIIDGLRSEAF
ncbi:hypothetical protein CerSpe_109410 [Prunus speciosa]